jgi:hypothetical protein
MTLLMAPYQLILYCSLCQIEHLFNWQTRLGLYVGLCGKTYHPLTLMLWYATDDYHDPVTLYLPERLYV